MTKEIVAIVWLGDSSMTEFISEHDGIVTLHPGGTMYHQRDLWDDLRKINPTEASKFVNGSKSLGVVVIDSTTQQIISRPDTLPTWDNINL